MDSISTYSAENGFSTDIKPPTIPILAIMMENSPLETIVNPIFVDAL